MKKNNLVTRFFLLSVLLVLTGFSAFAQTCEIMLYTTDFSNWGQKSGGSSNRFEPAPGSGGWEAEGGIRINDGTAGISTGSSNRRLRSPQFEFYGVGTVIVEIGDVTNTGRNLKVGDAAAQNITAAGTYTFTFPASGNQSVEFTFSNSGFFIKRIRICTDPGTTPFVAATNYTRAPSPGHTMQGAVGGVANSGTAVNALVNVKGWNISGDVILSIEGADAGKFSFPNANPDGTFTVANGDALTGINVPINFTPSVREGMASAVLVITNPNNPSQTYRVSLTGITGSGSVTPQILADINTVPFYTSLIADRTLPFNIGGVNLNAPVIITFDAPADILSRLKVAPSSIPASTANSGTFVDITYKGTITQSTHNIFMVLNSIGAQEVRIPLLLVTRGSRPVLSTINFFVSPPGTAYLDLTLTGKTGPIYDEITGDYLGDGIQVTGEVGNPTAIPPIPVTTTTVTVTPETGYEIAGWSDNPGSRAPSRMFRFGLATRNITVNMRKQGCNPATDPGCGSGPVIADGFVAFTPPASSITDDGFIASWSNAEGNNPTGYTVKVYGKNGTLLVTTVNAGMGNSINITGLKPATPTTENDFFFQYEVTTTTDNGVETTVKVGPIKLQGTIPFTCGQ